MSDGATVGASLSNLLRRSLNVDNLSDLGQYAIQAAGTIGLIITGYALGLRADVVWMAEGLDVLAITDVMAGIDPDDVKDCQTNWHQRSVASLDSNQLINEGVLQ